MIFSYKVYYILKEKHFFALEKLIKGKEKARVLYGPRDMTRNFPELNLVEIEDYLADAGNDCGMGNDIIPLPDQVINKYFTSANEIGDSIYKLENENYVEVYKPGYNKIKSLYIKILKAEREHSDWPLEWKDKWIEASDLNRDSCDVAYKLRKYM